VADALALRITHGDLLDACTALLGAGPWLLMLDGCEHVLERTRAIVTHLLARCPQLTVLATSRAPLGLATEQRLRLAPLDLRAPTDHDDVDSSPAVALFVDRARQVEPDLIFDRQELDLVVDIVRRLEGMPLAIELAAGRLSSLGLGDLHARLDHALDVLEGGEVALRQTISWSYDLLRPDDQRLLRHLSIFPDGVAVETVESVASDLGLGRSSHTALGHLVDASMVVRADAHASARYRQLDVVRAFAGEALTTVGEMDDAVARFIRWGIGLAEWIDSAIDTPGEPLADQALRRELANLRAVREMLRNASRFDDEVRFVTGLSEAAGWRDLTEVWEWTLELAVHPALVGHDDEVAVVGNAASAAWSRGELERAMSLAERGLARGGPTAWRCTSALALIALSRGDLERAAALGEAAGGAATRPEQSTGVAALAATYGGDIDRAVRLRAKARDIARSPTLSAFDAYVAGEIAASCGNHAEALENYERAIVIARDSGATFVEGIASVGRLTTLAGAGRTAEALQGYSELIGYWDRTDGWIQQWTTMRNLASLLMRLGEERPAVMLTVAADAAPDAPPLGGPERDALIDAARRRYGPETVDAAARATRKQVIAWARTAIDANCTTGSDP
jgi:predicted ATPase